MVTFTTDFGSGSPLVAAMKGVVLSGCPSAVLVDVSHEVPRFDVFAGAFMLFAGTRHFGGGSVHLAVVDPGVGSTRRRLIVQAGSRFYIGPDNGPRVLWADGFGNLVTNLKPPARRLRIHNHDITATAKTYSEARPGEPFVYVGSMGYLEVGVRESRADRLLGARPGMRVETI